MGGEFRQELERRLAEARLPELPNGEIGWVKVSRTKLDAYRRYVDAFFDWPIPDALDFHSLVVDTRSIDDRRFNEGSRETGFNKEIFQLCNKFAKIYSVPTFHVYPDRRQSSQGLEQLRLILNRYRTKQRDGRDWPFRRIHYRDGIESQALQLVDVLLGAISYRLNAHDAAPNASPAKMALCEHVLRRAAIRNVFSDTAIRGRFTIWHRRLR